MTKEYLFFNLAYQLRTNKSLAYFSAQSSVIGSGFVELKWGGVGGLLDSSSLFLSIKIDRMFLRVGACSVVD
jgi:hypothetical protein